MSNFKHGDARKGKVTRLHNLWRGILSRCGNPNEPAYPAYGGRGISVCDEWLVFSCFKSWAFENGYRDDLSIERVDNDSGYNPGNCRWATRKDQARNRRSTKLVHFHGVTKSLAEWAEIVRVPYFTLHARLRLGWHVDRAMTAPVQIQRGKNV